MLPWLELPASFMRTRAMARLDRERFEAAQARALRGWLDRDLPRVAAYPSAPRRLQDLPIMDKARLMADFAAFNRHGIGADAVRRALERDCRIGALTVGASTGTSGNRGYFVISEAERFRWLGAILAKAMAGLLLRPQRVAVLLPQDTRLYGSARSVPWLGLRFFPLAEGLERWRDALLTFAPTVIVAPPRILRQLAEERLRLAPRRLFSAAETLDPVDRRVIEAEFGLPLGQIYMATEGLLAVTCSEGRLHLAEDSVFFEYQPVGENLVSPLITSFCRQEQILARYRMNDLLRLSDRACPCGAPHRVVDEVVGRMDDCFRLGGRLITPDILRNAVVRADPRITDFRVIQQPDATVDLILPDDLPEPVAEAARGALAATLSGRGAPPDVALRRAALAQEPARKLRRIECRLASGKGPE